MNETIRVYGRDLKPHKATITPALGERTVLTNSHWEFVALWLKRKRKNDALFFWQQAQNFLVAAQGMPIASAPLLLYYAYMNSTKALLSAKGIPFDEHHGVRSHNIRGSSRKIALSNEGIRIMPRGVAPALSQYFGERETTNIHSLEDLLFNLPCIHRTFCLTYKNQDDMFIPLTDCRFSFDAANNTAYFAANLSKDFTGPKFLKRLPPSLVPDQAINDERAIRSQISVPLTTSTPTSSNDLAALLTLQCTVRPDLNYISGAQTLWYAKALVRGPRRLERSPLTSTLLAMHRLSEICRYRPIELAAFLSGQKNWLLTEFIRMSPTQFIDELAAELTGHQFMAPNVRPAT